MCVSVCSRLLVGAPTAKALKGQIAKVTGGLYNCDITSSSSCKRVEFDNTGELSFDTNSALHVSTVRPVSQDNFNRHNSMFPGLCVCALVCVGVFRGP